MDKPSNPTISNNPNDPNQPTNTTDTNPSEEKSNRRPGRNESRTLLGTPNSVTPKNKAISGPSLKSTYLGNPNSEFYIDADEEFIPSGPPSSGLPEPSSAPYILEEIKPPAKILSKKHIKSIDKPADKQDSSKEFQSSIHIPKNKIIKFPSRKKSPNTLQFHKLSISAIKENTKEVVREVVDQYGQKINMEPIRSIINFQITSSTQLPHALLAIAIMHNSFSSGETTDAFYIQANNIQQAYSGQPYDLHYIQSQLQDKSTAQDLLTSVFFNFIQTSQVTTGNSNPKHHPRNIQPKYLHTTKKPSNQIE